MNANKIQRIAIWDGGILLLFGFGIWLLNNFSFQPFSTGCMAIGGALVLFYFISKAGELKDLISRRSMKYNVNALMLGAIFLGILGTVNYITYSHEKRWDLTEQKLFSLSDQSRNLLENLDEPLEVRIFSTAGFFPAEDLLKSFTYVSDKFKYEIIDPDKRPEEAQRYNVTQNGTMVLEYRGQTVQVKQPSEEAITNAILKVSKQARKIVYFSEGHGERSINDKESNNGYAVFAENLRNENFDVRTISLAAIQEIPADASALVIAGPQKDLMPNEILVLRNYLGKRGHLMLAVDPPINLPSLFSLMSEYGVSFGQNVILDRVMRLFQGQGVEANIASGGYDENHPITEKFKPVQNFATLFSLVRTIDQISAIETYKVQELVFTGANSWAETDMDALFNQKPLSQEESEAKGPLAVAAAITKKDDPESGPRIVVFGDADFVGNRGINSYYNTDLGANSITWLAGEEDMISIRPPGPRISMVNLDQDQINTIFYLSVIILPLLLLLAGVNVWIWRR